MGSNHLVLLNSLITQQKKILAPDLSEAEFFEFFTAQEILKNEDLSSEEIRESITDGTRDGGIDSIFLFLNGVFIGNDVEEDIEVKKASQFELFILQSSTESGFRENKVITIGETLKDIFDFNKDYKDLQELYNPDICNKALQFKELYVDNASKFPKINIHFYYINKSLESPHSSVLTQSKKIKKNIEKSIGKNCVFDFQFINASDLWEIASKSSIETFELTITDSPIATTEKDTVCFVPLESYYKFITDENGNLIKYIFESNVRDYQGKVEVNRSIEQTLEQEDPEEEFWWLNNGITIICSNFTFTGKKLTIEDPQIVNGLQTSNMIYHYFSKQPNKSDKRHVLIRVIHPADSNSRDRIIKATNSQTAMLPAQLRATDKIQKNIEYYFEQNGLYYDRRKSFHKNQNRPLAKIIGISALSQAVHALLNGKPHESRAKPASLIKDEKTYNQIFNEKYDMQLYLNCAKIIKVIDKFMKSESACNYPKDLKYHLALLAICKYFNKEELSEKDLIFKNELNLSDELLQKCIENLYFQMYQEVDSAKTSFNTYLKRAQSTECIQNLLK
ncbi:AIPR family protein [Legionella longbeachae]|uniref:AIPR family protein n=1 Tax=Legionella longbeachae TaxID=450 RepID=UPI000A1C0092|nr:AIPR family protein [Legionella longbeachae]ARM32676.1 AIPR family protein [Legionella longbeachae]HBD7398039.1 AIPR family protein [Legionella pneumophila]